MKYFICLDNGPPCLYISHVVCHLAGLLSHRLCHRHGLCDLLSTRALTGGPAPWVTLSVTMVLLRFVPRVYMPPPSPLLRIHSCHIFFDEF